MFRTAMCLVLVLNLVSLSYASASRVSDEESASQTAVLLSQFESRGDSRSLSNYLHLDAKFLIPGGAIFGWYDDAFFPRGPGVITVTGVTIKSWTWGVTGVTYPNTAEVAFMQPFADGELVEDVVRLVKENGAWRWFFGRDIDFVNQQISRYTPSYPLLDASTIANSELLDGIAPRYIGDSADILVNASTLEDLLPTYVVNNVLGSVTPVESYYLPTFATDGVLAQYHTPPEKFIPSGEVYVYNLVSTVTVYDALSTFEVDSSSQSNFTVLRGTRFSPDEVMYILIDLYANDAVGNVPIVYWGYPNGTQLYSASMRDYVSLRILVVEMAKAMF